jgi:hypothetical protein
LPAAEGAQYNPGTVRKSALIALAVAVVAAFAWLWRSLEPPHDPARIAGPRVAVAPSHASPNEDLLRVPPPAVQTASAPHARRLPPARPAPSATPRGASGQPTEQPTPLASGGRAAAAPVALPLTGHPEQVRRLLQWAGGDLDAAIAWADGLADAAQRREALEALCLKIAERDPRAALDMVERFGLDDQPGVIVENLVAQWAEVDASAALDWITQRPAGDAQERLISRVAFALAGSDPHEAARLIGEQMGPGPLQTEAAASLVQRWWAVDPAAAADWVEGLAEGPLRDRALQELAGLDRGR